MWGRKIEVTNAKKLVLVLCVAALVENAEAADLEGPEQYDVMSYLMILGVVTGILVVYEFVKWCLMGGAEVLRGALRVREPCRQRPSRDRYFPIAPEEHYQH